MKRPGWRGSFARFSKKQAPRIDRFEAPGMIEVLTQSQGMLECRGMTRQVVIDLPEGAFSALRAEPAELGRELRLAAAIKWYELGKLSQAKAAEVAGLNRFDFIHALARYGVSPMQETAQEIAEGLAREK